jgi:hypothetical protein
MIRCSVRGPKFFVFAESKPVTPPDSPSEDPNATPAERRKITVMKSREPIMPFRVEPAIFMQRPSIISTTINFKY